jgi:CIC family chloride channel protein
MGQLVQAISRSNNNFIPVLDEGGKLLGVIDITRIRHIIFRTELYEKFTVKQLMIQPSARLLYNESMREVMKEFDATDAAQLPVVDVNNRLIGYISRTKMLADYRQVIADLSSE